MLTISILKLFNFIFILRKSETNKKKHRKLNGFLCDVRVAYGIALRFIFFLKL